MFPSIFRLAPGKRDKLPQIWRILGLQDLHRLPHPTSMLMAIGEHFTKFHLSYFHSKMQHPSKAWLHLQIIAEAA